MPIEVVLDASAAAKLLRTEPETGALRQWVAEARVRRVRFVVPEVFASEMRIVAAKAVAAGEISDASAAAEGCADMLSLVTPTSTSAEANIRLAVQNSLTTHDAAYVLLACEGRALVTYDARMAKAARAAKGCGPVLAPQ